MLKSILIALLPLLALFGSGSDNTLTGLNKTTPEGNTGTLEKLIVANGRVSMDLNLGKAKMSRSSKEARPVSLNFDIEHDAFFTVLVFNNELRGPMPSAMSLISQNSAALPGKLNASFQQLSIEKSSFDSQFDLVVRDAKTGFLFFTVEGQQFDYDGAAHQLNITDGRLRLSSDFAADLGRPGDAGSVVGSINIGATMRPIEITQYVDGEVKADDMPALGSPNAGSVPGPDVVVGDLPSMIQAGSSSGTQVGLAVGTTSCNFGVENLHWFALPDNDHPVIPQNLYRMSGGATNDERFEQIGQSNVKHAFTALTQNICNLGCNGTGGSNLGSGCSDPYDASLNSGPSLGSRAWINPFTGSYPRGDSATPPNTHTGHTHLGPSHRAITEIADLVPAQNPGATYYAESQYVTPHEYVWCQSHPGQCNMYNNVSYRRFSVTNSASPFTFSPVGATVRSKSAVSVWPGATSVDIVPDPGNDGIGSISYKVTNPSPGVWHYEYAVYNQNIDRAIQSLSIPMGAGVSLSNVGFHAPPQQPGWTFDGTLNNAGYSSTPWAQTRTATAMTFSTETFAQNQNANAIRWGTLYNFRFDSTVPPATVTATIGFFKTGAPITVQIQAPSNPAATVSGRVSAAGFGVRNAEVTMTDASNNVRSAFTGSFGYYSFENVPAGVTYTIAVASKRYTFTPQTMLISGNLSNVDFVATP
jgi:hypothetical protein